VIRVKICGITRPRDAVAAAQAGVDAIGLVFVKRSKRFVSVEQATEICNVLPPFVGRVGLFMDCPADAVRDVLESVPLDWLQFHGQEDEAWCRQFQRPWIKAIAMGDRDGRDRDFGFASAAALLLDSHAGGELGGSGQRFDWQAATPVDRPWILAGGLDPDNVATACRQLRPAAVDVSSGVESHPGIKDDKLMIDFVKAVKNG
jgi:phosphoribosylanthranilate isomerase